MAFMNRRNAFFGWLVWEIGKRVARKRVRSAIPGRGGDEGAPKLPLVLGGLAAVGGALWLWFSRGDGDEDDEG